MLFQCPKLTPLQSRFLASFSALVLIGLIYWLLSHPHFAYAAELETDGAGQSRVGEDHNWHRIEQQRLEDDGLDAGEGETIEPEVELRKRQTPSSTIDGNDSPNNLNINPGNTTLWKYPSSLLQEAPIPTNSGLPGLFGDRRGVERVHAELRQRDTLEERQSTSTIFVSINTCLQPSWNGPDAQAAAPPQLNLYVATTSGNTDPGPKADETTQLDITLDGGFANASVTASGDCYIAVVAPPLPSGFSGGWNYELAVSRTDFYHAANLTDSSLYLADTDMQAALLVTADLTQANASDPLFYQWLNLNPPPFIMFAANQNHTSTMGIEKSYCGWKNAAQITASQQDVTGNNTHVNISMVTRGVGGTPKEQFYITNLNSSSSYRGVLAMAGNSTNSGKGIVGGGGKVWQPVDFVTKTNGNCALLFDLEFCDQVAYAVPTNATANSTALQRFYDNYTTVWYKNFDFSLQQVPCNTTSDAQYSLVQNCTMCAAAYKRWLCAVSIPRCMDFVVPPPNGMPELGLQPRAVSQPFLNNSGLSDDFLLSQYIPMTNAPNLVGTPKWSQTYNWSFATNQSRNPMIDQAIQPGPYTELLPCEDLCYSIVQSCPASLGFGCPYVGRGLEAGYGFRTPGQLTCNAPGELINANDAGSVIAPVVRAVAYALTAGLALVVL